MTLAVQADVVVVFGGGPAGLAAAVALGRCRRSVVVVDTGQPRHAPAAGAHNLLGQEGVPPLELPTLDLERPHPCTVHDQALPTRVQIAADPRGATAVHGDLTVADLAEVVRVRREPFSAAMAAVCVSVLGDRGHGI